MRTDVVGHMSRDTLGVETSFYSIFKSDTIKQAPLLQLLVIK